MKKLIRILVPVLLAALVIASIGWYLFVYDRDFTRDMLLQQARYNDMHGNSAASAWFYNLAYRHSGQDQNVAIELANQYKAAGNYTKAEVTLSNAIKSGATAELYTALCKTYVEQDKLLDAVSMLANISDPTVKAQLEALRPSAPTADYSSGYYNQYISVSLTSSSGTLYCTTNGEYPSIAQAPYSEPITLPLGETQIYAISVGDNGLVSPVTVLGYTIGGVIEPVIFMDIPVENAIREALACEPSHVIYTNDLWQIKEFTVPAEASSLEDLKHMTFLEKLTINNRNMSNLNDISELSKLKSLDLTGCRFPAEELETIASLSELQELTISGCGLSTLSGLETAVNLIYLDASSNSIRKLEPLSNLSKLSELHMQHNVLDDLSVLNNLPELSKLDVSYNSLSSIAPVTNCVKLTLLNASNNQLTSAGSASTLPLLTDLMLDYNSISDISDLSGCKAMTTLTISNNSIVDLSPLAGLSNLTFFDFSYNKVESLPEWPSDSAMQVIDGSYNAITSIDSLAKLADISYIYMDYNKITSVDALANCFHLVQVNVYGNEIESVSSLLEHDIIVNFDPTKK